RPDNKYDTKYKKVFYRNDDKTRLYNSTLNWATEYANSDNLSISVSNQSSLIYAKYNSDKEWEFKSFIMSSDFSLNQIDETSRQIIDFFQEEEKIEKN
ncbi:MAG: hypothetical protein ACRC4M_00565, partial [Mycoplasma sp.]